MIEMVACSLSDALAIERSGADRIVLVTALGEGGFTPSIGLVMAIIDRVRIPISVMLRPNRRDFYYTNKEMEILRRDAFILNQVGVKQVVMAILSPDDLPDIRRMEQVLDGTNLKLTFHMEMDATVDTMKSIRYLNTYDRLTHILTSGGQGRAIDHIDHIRHIIIQSHKRIIVGNGVEKTNLADIQKQLAGLSYDLHAGAEVRNGDVRGHVSLTEAREFVEQVTE